MKLNIKFLIIAMILLLAYIIQIEAKRIKKANRKNHFLKKYKKKVTNRNTNKVHFLRELRDGNKKNKSKPDKKDEVEEEKIEEETEEKQKDYLILNAFKYIFEEQIGEDSKPDNVIKENFRSLENFGKFLLKYFEDKNNRGRIEEKLKVLFFEIYNKKFDKKKIVKVQFHDNITLKNDDNLLNMIHTHLANGKYMIEIDQGNKISFYDKHGHFRIKHDDMKATNYVYFDDEKIDKDGNFEFIIYGKTKFHIDDLSLQKKENSRIYEIIVNRKINGSKPTSTEEFEILSYKLNEKNLLKEIETKKDVISIDGLSKVTQILNGWNLVETPTPGDGFCLLNSISGNNYYDYLDNMNIIITTLTTNNNPEIREFVEGRYGNLNSFVNALYDPQSWMTNEGQGIIVYIARCLNINIRVVRTNGVIIPVIGRAETIEANIPINQLNTNDHNLFDVTITHNGNHFNATRNGK